MFMADRKVLARDKKIKKSPPHLLLRLLCRLPCRSRRGRRTPRCQGGGILTEENELCMMWIRGCPGRFSCHSWRLLRRIHRTLGLCWEGRLLLSGPTFATDLSLARFGSSTSTRVTDMAFFAEVSKCKCIWKGFVWKIDEGPDHGDKPQITGKLVLAIQLSGDGDYHPRICWHSHKQEILVVGIGNNVVRIDTSKIGKGKEFSADEPLKCPIEKLVEGVQLVGKHDAEVTDLSISQWMTTRLASASNHRTGVPTRSSSTAKVLHCDISLCLLDR